MTYPEIEVLSKDEIRPVDVLLELVKERKIDPWEIDLVDLTEKYLTKIKEITERNLRLSARTLLAASVLLRIKSDLVLSIERKYQDEIEELHELEEGDSQHLTAPQNVSLTPGDLPLGISIQRKMRRKVTLAELVTILDRVMGDHSDSHRMKKLYAKSLTKDLIRIDTLKKDIRAFIEQMYEDMKEQMMHTPTLSFSSIIKNADRLNKARLFLYTLFLAHQEKLLLHQKAPFEEIFITLPIQAQGG